MIYRECVFWDVIKNILEISEFWLIMSNYIVLKIELLRIDRWIISFHQH